MFLNTVRMEKFFWLLEVTLLMYKYGKKFILRYKLPYNTYFCITASVLKSTGVYVLLLQIPIMYLNSQLKN
jgi:hypothetical protein